MAKVKRIIRKREPAPPGFDQQVWPINLALFVLGSFLVGVALAYQRFDDPRWWCNALTSVIAVPLLIISTMIGVRLIGNRVVRRTMQLATVISLVLHLLFILATVQLTIFSRPISQQQRPQEPTQREVRISQYDPFRREQQDFERPVELDTPEIEPTPVEREQPEEQEHAPPQPAPVPEPQPTPNPNVVERTDAPTPTPRRTDQAARVARSEPTPTPDITRSATAAEPTRPTPSATAAAAAAASLTRPNREAQPQRQPTAAEPTTSQTAQRVETPRRDMQPAPNPQAAQAAALPRATASDAATPRAQVAANVNPAAPRQTAPAALQPAATEMSRQRTASPQRAQRAEVEPTPVTPDRTASAVQRREQPSPQEPMLADTPQPIPNRRSRVTPRPEASTASQQVAPPSPSQAAPTAAPARTSVARSTTQVNAERPAVETPATPTPSAAPSTVARREATAETTPAASPATSVARSQTPATPAPSMAAAAPSRAGAQRTAPDAPRAADSTATRRQETPRPQVARAAGEPTTPGARSAPSPQVQRGTRSQRSQDAPTSMADPGAIARRRVSDAQPNVAASASESPVSASPAPSATGGLQPALSTLTRQATSSPGAAASRPSRDAPTASAESQIAQSSPDRVAPADAPSIAPLVRAAASPARAAVDAPISSPTPAARPALAQNANEQSQPNMQATPTAVSRSTVGRAGVGRSANLDRAEPATPNNPALAASASAQRRESTRANEAGPDLSATQAAVVARSRADADRPAAFRQAQAVEVATTSAADQPEMLSATSSAALTQRQSNAAEGEVTAMRGDAQIDMGPTSRVANAAAGRASGGGQPELNPNPQRQVARADRGGAEAMALLTDQPAEMPAAPAAEGGGQPQVEAVAASEPMQRMNAGGESPSSSGPTPAAEGPTSTANAAELVAEARLRRATAEMPLGDAGAEGGGGAEAAEDDKEDEEERQRRLAAARAAGGAPEVAIAGIVADSPSGEPAPGGGAAEALPAAAAQVPRQALASGGTPAPPGSQSDPQASAGPEGGSGAEVVRNAQVARAEAADAVASAPRIGGGTAAPARAAAGPAFVADLAAEEVQLAGQTESAGQEQGSPLAAQGVEVARTSSGARMADGFAASQVGEASPGRSAGPGAAQLRRAAVAAAGPADFAGAADLAAAPARQTGQIGAPIVEEAASPSDIVFSETAPTEGDLGSLEFASARLGPGSPAAASSISVRLSAPEGPSGLIGDSIGTPGVNSRRAREDSVELATRTAKFVRQDAGGLPDFNTTAIAATDAFRKRSDRHSKAPTGGKGRPGPQTERAIESGLTYLAKCQLADGSWNLNGMENVRVAFSSDVAATGLCLLAYQGAGYNHREFKYADVVRGGVEFLLKNQDDDGLLFVPADVESNKYVKLYTHGIATIALCEAYGMTQDPALKEPAQRALDYIVQTQDKRYGGWRYTPGQFSDTSVTGWMLMALKSGDLAGLKVPASVYDRIQVWLDMAQASKEQRHLYVYNPHASQTDVRRTRGRLPSKSMTAVGLLCRLYTGWRRDNPHMIQGAAYLTESEQLPAFGFKGEDPVEKKRDTYYWYYATQVLAHMGGEQWDTWYGQLHDLLIESQIPSGPNAGSWDPINPVYDRWGGTMGPVYMTTMNLLSLEVYYRLLPLYDETVK